MNSQLARNAQRHRVSPANRDDLFQFLRWVFLEKGYFFGFQYPMADDAQRAIGTRIFSIMVWIPFFILGIGNVVQSLLASPSDFGPSIGWLLLCMIGCALMGWLGKSSFADLDRYVHVLIMAACGVPAFGTIHLFGKLILTNTNINTLNMVMLIPFYFAVFLLIGLTDLNLGVVKISRDADYIRDTHLKHELRSIVIDGDEVNVRGSYLVMPLFAVGQTTHLCIVSILGGIVWGVLAAYDTQLSFDFVSIILDRWPLFKVMLPLVVGIITAGILRISLELPQRFIPVVALLCIPIAYIVLIIFLILRLG